jgi:alpha-beta hydrolase superfamily lysophospholipase
MVSDIKSKIKAKGFSSDEFYVASHSLGTVVTGDWLPKNANEFKGSIMMGGGI